MRLALLLVVALPAFAQEAEVQRALIMRDQQSAQFAARLGGAPLAELQRLENLGARQLLEVQKDPPPALRAYERQNAAQAHVLALPPPVVRASAPEEPRPLPVKVPGVVNVVPAIDKPSLSDRPVRRL
ncbi:MAG: hypothetical protein ACREVD_13435 [Burkholderiales bacterium]